MKFFKSLTVVLTISLANSSYGGIGNLFKDKLENNELENIYICENTDTGVARFSNNLLYVASTLRKSGVKFNVYKSSDEIDIEIGQVERLQMNLKKIAVGDLKKYNISCYQAQELEGPKGTLSVGDQTLNINTLSELGWFGYLQPTEKDKMIAKEKNDKSNALEVLREKQQLEKRIAKEQKQAAIEKAKDEKLAQIAKNKKKIERVEKTKIRKALNAKRNRYLSMIEEFERKSKIHQLKDKSIAKSKLILTDEVLDDLMLLLDNLESEIEEGTRYGRLNLRLAIDKAYNLFDKSQRIKNQTNNMYYFYKQWSEPAKEGIKGIQK